MKYLIFLLLSLLLSFISHADFTPFDFSLGRYLIDEHKEIRVSFKYDLVDYDEKDFLIRPVIKNGIVEVFNPDTNLWTGSFQPISEMSYLKEEALIRVKGLSIEKSSLDFEIYNIKSGEIYSTSAKDIWSKKVYSKYIESLNGNLSNNFLNKEERAFESDELVEFAEIEIENKKSLVEKINEIPETYVLLFGVFCFLSSFLLGFGFKWKGNRREKVLDVKNRIYSVNGKIH